MKAALSILSLLFTASASAGGLRVHGDGPLGEYPGLESKLDQIWQYEKQKYPGKDVADPEIFFFPFVREQETPEWVAWQNSWIRANPSIWQDWVEINGDKAPKEITPEWIDEHIATLFPFPKTFRAFSL